MGFYDSTQAPDDFQELGGPVQHQNILDDNQEDNQIQGRGRGKAKGTKCLKLCKLGRVPVKVPDSSRNVCKWNIVNQSKFVVPHTSRSKSLQNLCAEKSAEEENLIEFYKSSHVAKRDVNFKNDKAKHTYEEMMKLFAKSYITP
ncbi:hypothetical protein CJ030_MR3G001254 [Morella rubra]|uniref:Uncharacterized protein n=1 Tax=Morella rubra TaxID=262757 RepID=A0A6A1W300_9ROSI|nr:hypothetical protein CJ030_MR3G001254 [Morella rubra]